jgi:CBS domain containing-hemolysin-like protein
LAFGDKQAADILQPRKHTYLINADDSIGPILLDQLHKSGQASFLVYKDKKDNIVGSLTMHDAVAARQGGRVFDLIRNDLAFVHEDFGLKQVLTAFQKTGQHVVLVVNKFEEFLGVITLDDLLKELVGEQEPVLVENYENRSTVAAYQPIESATVLQEESVPESESESQQPTSVDSSSPDSTEVVK